MFCRPVILCSLNCVTETIQKTEGRRYFPECHMLARPVLMCGREKNSIEGFVKTRGQDHLVDLGISGSIILKWIGQESMYGIHLVVHDREQSTGSCEHSGELHGAI